MTEKTSTTRFSSLEAIPLHARGPRGVRGALAMLYIRRRRTLPALAGILACSAAAVFVLPSLVGPSATPAVKPIDVVAIQPPVPSKDSKPPVEVVSVVEHKLPESQPPKASSTPVSPDAEKSRQVEVVSPAVAVPAAAVAREEPAIPRRIIPVSEGMSLYDARQTGEPPKVAGPVAVEGRERPFFVEGLPSEEETLAFFKSPAPETTPATVATTSPVEAPAEVEDMAPTVSIPDVVPTPAPRPQVADGRVEFRIEQGVGVQSGFVLYNKDDKNLRRYFVVARAFQGGAPVPWKFKDIADGKNVATDKFAIEVSEKAFRGLSEEKKKFGKVVHEVLGTAKDDEAKIDWAIESSGNMLAAPEGRS